MDCAQNEWLSDKEYFQQFNRKVAQQRIPLTGSVDLTHRCNLMCVHCYIGDKEIIKGKRNNELSTTQWISIIDQVTEAGCLYFLITGGEPLLRRDFGEIYRHAKMSGLIITLFTNGTMITKDILGLFQDLPPGAVEISLYGATRETYEKITGVKGSYDRCMSGIQKLLDHQINLRLKTILMSLNRHEFHDIENLAKEYGVKFRFDAGIFPQLDGDKSPIGLRVAPREAIQLDFSSSKRRKEWQDYYEKRKSLPNQNTLYTCGAGITGFHIDPYGNLQPCLMANNIKNNIKNSCFIEGWRSVIPKIREKKAGIDYFCNQCKKRDLCGMCPAFFRIENGAEDIRSEYLCALGHYRFEELHASK